MDGAHLAAMAGSWMALVFGFGGLRVNAGKLRFQPTVPPAWSGYAFRLYYRRAILEVRVRPSRATYELIDGEGIELVHREMPVSLTSENPKRSL